MQYSLEEAGPMHKPMQRRTQAPFGRFALVVLLPLLIFMGCGKTDQTSETTSGGKPPGENAEGSLDAATGELIAGWAWDSDQPDNPIKVDIFDGDKKLATVLADQFRDDLLKEKKGNGKHSFSYPTPAGLKGHTIRVKISGTGTELSGSPQTVKSP
jgi:hypothetical protein